MPLVILVAQGHVVGLFRHARDAIEERAHHTRVRLSPQRNLAALLVVAQDAYGVVGRAIVAHVHPHIGGILRQDAVQLLPQMLGTVVG